MDEASSNAEKQEAFNKYHSSIGEQSRELEKVRVTLEESYTQIERLFPFWRQVTDVIYKLRLCEFRCGSNSVLNAGEVFIKSLYDWNELYSSGDRLDQLTEQVRTSHEELNRALANALKFGPYDKYNPK